MKYQYLKNWKKERLLRNLHCSSKVAVIDNTSLTKRLESIKDNNFKVKVLSQKVVYTRKFIFDRKLKNFKGYNVARTVSIESNNCPTITALTFYPCRFLSGRERFIKLLGNKSLGAYILDPRRFKKYYVSYKIIQNEIHRIVVYIFKNKRILVDEIFPMSFRYKDLSLLQARRKI